MKKIFLLPLYYIVSCSVIPFLITTAFVKPKEVPAAQDSSVTVLNHTTGKTEELDEAKYLRGVLAAEMPASFETEALKAQAVAARTYAMYKASSKTHEADVCTDSSHCQAYMTDEEMKNNWGDDYEKYSAKLESAVAATKGQYLTYEEKPVMAVFHSMGGGRTESSIDVWGENVPYLVSVDSPGEESASNYHTSYEITFADFKSKILSKYPSAVINTPLDVSLPVLTDGGHVKSLVVGGITVPGTDIRTLFSLRSTMFSISFEGDNVIFSVTGYGHGVGMSQYGANAMAKGGSDYKEILSHYYPGTKLIE